MPGIDNAGIGPNIKALMREDVQYDTKPKNAMGKDEFLKLLLAQLQNQDPMKPMDHHEFVAQLAQFSSLEQLTNIGSGIQNLKTGMGEGQKLQALAMIGKNIQAGTQQITLTQGQPTTIPFKPNPELKPQKAQIYETISGKVIREVDLSQMGKSSEFMWDGKTDDDRWAPSGQYSFKVMGSDAKGQYKDMTAEVAGKVIGMEMNGTEAVLQVQTPSGVVKLDMGKVKSVMGDADNSPSAAPATPTIAAPKMSPVLPKMAQVENGEDAPEAPEAPEAADAADIAANPNQFFENLFNANPRGR